MSIKERFNLERDDRRHESTQARLAERHKFTGCRECGSDFGMFSATREQMMNFLPRGIEKLAPWYKEPGNDLVLYHLCMACNWKGARGVPDDLELISVTDVQAWRDDIDPMQPDYAALAAEPEPVLASLVDRKSAGLEG